MVAIHEKGYIHQNLNLENIFIDEKNKILKISEFGLAKKHQDKILSKQNINYFEVY
jgi:serine/threonine protein kinase